MPKPIKLPLPVKGINRNLARSDQSLEYAWDALNVMPYDRYDRLRIGQRPGASKLWASAIGSGTQFIQTLSQTTINLDPLTIRPDTQVLNEPFTYANGSLETVATIGVWKTYGASVTHDATAYDVASNTVKAHTSGLAAAVYQPSLSLGSAYIVQFDLTFVQLTGVQSGLAVRINKTTPSLTTTGIFLGIAAASTGALTLNLGISFGGATLGTFTSPVGLITLGSVHTFTIQVNGDHIVAGMDGITYLTADSASNNTQVGIGIATNSSNTAHTFDNFIASTGKKLASYRQNNIVAVVNGDVYQGDISTQATIVTGGAAQLFGDRVVQFANYAGQAYFLDGHDLRQLNLTTKTMVTFTPTAGTETEASLGQYTVIAVYRGRLALAANRTSPQNFIFSRVGTPTDFDYSQTDPAAAFAGNASVAGRIGEPIVALMPFSDDILLIGGDHDLWAVRGDPADGGSIDLVSDAIGILGPQAWCKAPDGTVYFVGTGGLYSMDPAGGKPTLLSDQTYNQFFSAINRGTNYVQMVYDRDRQGAYVFVTPANTGPTTHLFFDKRNGGFWPVQYPDSFGPYQVMTYDGDGPTDRATLLGGRDGLVQKISPSAFTDNGTAISSNIVLGPFQPATPTGDSVVTGLDVTLGELAAGDVGIFQCKWTLEGGKSAYEVSEGTARRIAGGTFTSGGKQLTRVTRVRGGWFSIKFANSTSGDYFSLERVVAQVEGQGKQR